MRFIPTRSALFRLHNKRDVGAFTEADFDLMISAVSNKEVNLFATLMTEHRIVKVAKYTRVIIVTSKWTHSKIRAINTDVHVWIVNEAIGSC